MTSHTAPPTPDHCLSELEDAALPRRAVDMAAYHKIERRYLGVPDPEIDRLARQWRQAVTLFLFARYFHRAQAGDKSVTGSPACLAK